MVPSGYVPVSSSHHLAIISSSSGYHPNITQLLPDELQVGCHTSQVSSADAFDQIIDTERSNRTPLTHAAASRSVAGDGLINAETCRGAA